MVLLKRDRPQPWRPEPPFNLRRHVGWIAALLVTLTGMAIRTYFTTQANADSMASIAADVKYLLRNDQKQDQAIRDGEKDRDHLRQRVNECSNRGGNGDG